MKNKKMLFTLLIVIAIIAIAGLTVIMLTKNETKGADNLSGLCVHCGHAQNFTADGQECKGCGHIVEHVWERTDSKHICMYCEESGTHTYYEGRCTVCLKACEHDYGENQGYKKISDTECSPLFICKTCGYEYTNPEFSVPHTWNKTTGKCTKCGATCNHVYGENQGYKKISNTECSPLYICEKCGYEYINPAFTGPHTWDNTTGKCEKCGATCSHNWDIKVTKEATCKETGIKTYTCKNCSTTKTETIAKTDNHNWKNAEGKCTVCEASHTHAGGEHLKGWNCSTCNYLYKEECHPDKTKAPIGYSLENVDGDFHYTIYPCTCGDTVTGYRVAEDCNYEYKSDSENHWQECVCGKKKANVAHTIVTDAGVEATCTTAGKTEGKHCSVCNAVIKAQETIPAKGHTEVTDARVEATCTTAGKTEGKHCSACNAVIKAQEVIPAKGHTEVTDARVEATCTTSGKTEGKHCSACNAVIKAQEVIPAKGHTEVTDARVEATCTTAGKTEGKHCSACNAVIKAQEVIPAKGHNYVDGECTVCGAKDPAYQEKCKDGHTWNEGTVTKAATCKEKGEKTYTCTKCGETKTEEIAKTNNHTWNEGTVTKAATCKEKGIKTYTCTVCNTTKTEEIEKTNNHNYKDGECTVCGAKDPAYQEECKHEHKIAKKDETYHWTECEDCGKVIGEKEKHSYKDGECKCGAKDPEYQAECKHEKTIDKKDETYHWKECEDCGKVIGEKEKHSYKDGKCECGAEETKEEPEKECEHKNTEWKSNENKHYKVCKDCGKTIEGTEEKHTYVDGVCKCGAKDSTSTKKDMPNTGTATIITTIVALTAISGGAAIGIKKYKDIV